MKPARIFFCVAEDSADAHAAALMRCAAAQGLPWTFAGLSGPRTRALGAETIFDMASHAAMLTGALGLVGRAWKALAAIESDWRTRRPAVVLLLDSPELNLRVATRARAHGIPVLYYIAPQTWASRAGRTRRIARDVNQLACILPFEEPYFRANGVQAEYVGHPLFETLRQEPPSPQRVAALRDADGPLIALLPGSRRHVIESVLPIQLDVLQRLRALGIPARAAISAVDEQRAEWIRTLAAQAAGAPGAPAPRAADRSAPPEIVVADNASLLSAADLVLVASGTATLHVGAYRKPMIVLYDAGLLGRLHGTLGRFVLRTPHLSLLNILARRRIVPEFMPRVPDRQAVARVAAGLLRDGVWRAQMIADIGEIVRPLERSDASARVCELLAALCDS